MTAARLKRIAALESRKRRVFVPFDDGAAAALLRWHLDNYAAVEAGRACLIPVYGPHPEPSLAMAAVMRELDRVAARLAAEPAWRARRRVRGAEASGAVRLAQQNDSPMQFREPLAGIRLRTCAATKQLSTSFT
jgi:hypothetical protein